MAGAAELAASSLRKKAEQEANNLRKEMAEAAKRADAAYAQLKKKHDETVNEFSRQVESLIKAKSKWVTTSLSELQGARILTSCFVSFFLFLRRLEKERLSLIAGNDKAREPVGFLDKDEVSVFTGFREL